MKLTNEMIDKELEHGRNLPETNYLTINVVVLRELCRYAKIGLSFEAEYPLLTAFLENNNQKEDK